MRNKEEMLMEISRERLTTLQIRERYNVTPKYATHLKQRAGQLFAVTNSQFVNEAIARVEAWVKEGKPMDNLGRVPVNLIGDIKIAKRHGFNPFEPSNSGKLPKGNTHRHSELGRV